MDLVIDLIKCGKARAYHLYIVLNGTTDHSEEVLAAYPEVKIMKTEAGLVEAQRAFAANHAEAPFIIFSDADILLDIEAVFELTKTMIENPELPAAYAEKVPLRPHRKTFLAEALYRYNLYNGYQSVRHYLNGQFFAIRKWQLVYFFLLHLILDKKCQAVYKKHCLVLLQI